MAVFTYQALSSSAQDVRGTIAAESPREAREKLRAQGLVVETIEQQRAKSGRRWPIFARSGRYASQLATTIRDLATLLSTGIGFVDRCAPN